MHACTAALAVARCMQLPVSYKATYKKYPQWTVETFAVSVYLRAASCTTAAALHLSGETVSALAAITVTDSLHIQSLVRFLASNASMLRPG